MGKDTRPHNYLKIAEDSETGKKLKAFLTECSEASEKARIWAENQGADTYYESPEFQFHKGAIRTFAVFAVP